MQYSIIGNQAHAAVALAAARIGRIPTAYSTKRATEVNDMLAHQVGASLALVGEDNRPIAAGVRATLRCLSALAPMAQLHGRSAFEEAKVDMWIEIALNELAFGNAEVF